MQQTINTFKHRIRDLLICVFVWTGTAWMYRASMRKAGPLVRIIVFHDVPDETWFDGLINELKANYRIITPLDFIHRRFDSSRINVLITFDDGYASWETHVLPLLGKHGIKGLFFVSSGLLDVAEDAGRTDTFMRENLMIRARAPLSWSGARALKENGHTFGVHGRNHRNLAMQSTEVVHEELAVDKERIETMLSIEVTECAYPFGTPMHVNETVERVAKQVGFSRGYTAVSHFVDNTETFAIPRMCIESDVSPRMIRYWIDGAYDMFNILKSLCVR